MFAKKRLTARGYSKILKTARTIADIDGNVNITTANISEAFYYRGIPEVDNTLKKQYTRQEKFILKDDYYWFWINNIVRNS
ncbi:MAG: hypothetical protein ACLUZ6_08865 [Lachnospira eligens]